MGYLFKDNSSNKKDQGKLKVFVNSKGKEVALPKPIEEFAWKSASKEQLEKESIKVYKEYAF